MAKSLVIVESPAKAKTINKYLGSEFSVKASLGHVKDLPKKGLGVDIKKNFEPTYQIIPGKEKVIRELRSAAKGVNSVYIATDPDREGEAIGAHLAEELSSRQRKIFRVLFNEITPKAIREAFEKPGTIDGHLVEAQQARRILDRLVGYKISPLLWVKVRRGTSAGRVQTVALRLVVEREREIRSFIQKEYWTIDANLSAHLPPAFDARLQKFAGKTLEIVNGQQAEQIVESLRDARFIVESIEKREKKRHPVPPFITSKLQQEASRKLGFTVKKTMALAQRLYEGIELGDEGSVGLITYMRTDSTRVSNDALEGVRQYVASTYGESYLPEKPIFYKSKKGAQDAHEAIRPTSVSRKPDEIKRHLSADEYKLYKLIWQRFVASQMKSAVFDQTLVEIGADKYLFKASGSVMKFDGFLTVYSEGKDEKDEEDEELEHPIPPMTKGEILALNQLKKEQHFTQPPPRYTEATLVKALEEKGIGRPSTYATILTTIQEREYVLKQDGKFSPMELGFIVNDLLVENFADIFEVEYTARMEEELDEIEDGKLAWTEALDEFYKKFEVDLKQAQKHMTDVKKMEEPTDEKCEKCGSGMVIKWGRHGRFLACSAYPECKNTREIARDNGAAPEGTVEVEQIEEICENCGKPMTLKRGRFGQFLACTGYPECKTTKRLSASAAGKAHVPDIPLNEACPECGKNLVIKHGRYGEFTACGNYPECKYVRKKTLGIACPQPNCKGELVERKSRRGKFFYGCNQYPKCQFTLWNKPVSTPCPKCGAGFVVEKITKRQGTIHYCNSESCDYKEVMEMVPETQSV
ncbi:MAG TPA: type I DNA topoisomerase [Terriglobia bacterium]|nr:type I DNA topoisomerase [Terriglobia bacterium]